jgi:hypothetical protein
MSENKLREIFNEAVTNIERASKTELTVVVCGPGKPEVEKSDSPYLLREAVRRSLKDENDQVFFLEDLVTSEEGEKARKLLESKLTESPRMDQIEILILKGKTIDKDVHIVEGVGAILELGQFLADRDVFKKVYAFVNERYRNDRSYIQQSAFVKLSRADRLYWFNDESDLKSKVKDALIANRIAKSGIMPA